MKKISCVLAPMAGITDKPYRLLIRKFTKAPLFTEMVGVGSLMADRRETKQKLDLSNESEIVVQLVGADPLLIAKSALIAEKKGAVEININMGCPVKKLIVNQSGASLMLHPEHAVEIVKILKKAVQVPVSIKTRIGWKDIKNDMFDFFLRLQEAGIDRIYIHGRFKEQGNTGDVNFEELEKFRKILDIPFYGNGGIKDRKSAEDMICKTGVDGVMIGQGTFAKPWIISEIETGNCIHVDIKEMMEEHFELMLSYYGEHGVKMMRKFYRFYLQQIPVKEERILKELYQLNKKEEVLFFIRHL